MLNRDQIAHEYILSGVENTVKGAFHLADAMIAESQKRKNVERPDIISDGWISVEDRLPNELSPLVIATEEWVNVGYFSKESGWFMFYNDSSVQVTHWQPLPSPPKGVVK